ncbi:MAG TPA: histidine kinase, partial [Sediminibacterium sp.]|nr:histidine kinase [Sediminibacterium sp.]
MAFISWWLIWAVIGYSLLNSYDFSFLICITDSLLCNLLLAGACLLIANNMKYYLPRQERYWYVLLMSIVLSGIWLLLVQLLLKLFFKNQSGYLAFLSQSLSIRYLVAFLMIACIAVVSLLWRTLQEQQESSQRREAAEKLTKDAELMQLRRQLQPHFLFNSLNSISALAGSRP